MTAEEIIEQFPKTIEKLKKKFEGAQLPPGFTADMMVGNILTFAPRQLFDFFDQNKVNIIIYNEHSGRWLFDLFDNDNLVEVEETDYPTREEAEKAGYTAAFKITESK